MGSSGRCSTGEAEIGVHSAKDLPTELTEGLMLASVPAREDPRDAWIGTGSSLEDVPEGARVGTASLRRRAQLLAARPDLAVSELHGNVDTRLRKLAEGELDAIVLAVAGLRRLGREDEIAFAIPAESMTPAAGQGSLLLQIRAEDEAALRAVEPLIDEAALRELTAERTVVALLEATCNSPIGVHAQVDDALDRMRHRRLRRPARRQRVDARPGRGRLDRADRCSAPSWPSACSASAPARSSTEPSDGALLPLEWYSQCHERDHRQGRAHRRAQGAS